MKKQAQTRYMVTVKGSKVGEIGVTENLNRDVSMYGGYRLCPVDCSDIATFTLKQAERVVKSWANDGFGANVPLQIVAVSK